MSCAARAPRRVPHVWHLEPTYRPTAIHCLQLKTQGAGSGQSRGQSQYCKFTANRPEVTAKSRRLGMRKNHLGVSGERERERERERAMVGSD